MADGRATAGRRRGAARRGPRAARVAGRRSGRASHNPALGEIARQRLAQVLGAQNKADEALKLLEGDADKAFLATREELKGDLLVQLGRTDEASAAYQKAKAALSDEAAVGGLQIKLDDLAKGDA